MKKELRKLLTKNSLTLENSSQKLEDIYNIMFSNTGILAEDTDSIKINTYTYSDINKRIIEASSSLYEKVGSAHQYIALEMENGIDWIISFWAILRSGNKPYLVNCRHPKSLINSSFKTLDIQYVIVKESSVSDAQPIRISDLRTSFRFEGDFEDEIVLSTSATSLKEVICFYTGAQLSAQILNVNTFITKHPQIAADYQGRIKNLAFLPFYHIFGLIAVYFWFTFFGQTVVFLKDYSADTITKTCRKLSVTHIFAVPMLWHTIENTVLRTLKNEDEKTVKKFHKGIKFCNKLQRIFPDLGMKLSQKIMHRVTDKLFGQSVKFCINGGSYIRQSSLEMMNCIGYNLHNGYGMSEIGIASVELRNNIKYKNLNSIGTPFSSVQYKIDDSGVLMVKGTSICSKLLIQGEEKKIDEWFNTGDIVEYSDGTYYIKGRLGDVIIGEDGENINPDVIEQQFHLPEAEGFSVLGMKKDDKVILTLIVQINKYMSENRKNSLIDTVHKVIETLPAGSKIQKIYYTTDSIKSESAVKVSRKWLLRAIENKTVTLNEYIKTESVSTDSIDYNDNIYNSVVKIISDVLDIDQNTITKSSHIMLDLGADSMQYFSILTALSKEFSVTSSTKDTLLYTPHEICKYIERHL